MATDRNTPDAIERLNALIDGELPPAEHATLADRIAADRDLAQSHATLARLKACIVENAEDTPAEELVLLRPRTRRRPILAVAGASAAMAAAALIAVFVWGPERKPATLPVAEIAPYVTLAALPDTPVIPDLANAGLKLVGGEVERSGETAVLVAVYRGPRGCRLELRVRPVAATVPATVGTSRKVWTAGDLAYELVAFGMPASRFDAVAAATQAATLRGRKEFETRLREASLQTPPCIG